MPEKDHEELCNCSYCKNARRKAAEKNKAKKEDVPPHHFHTSYTIELAPGDEGYEENPSERSRKANHDYRSVERNLGVTMLSRRAPRGSRATKTPTSPTEAYEHIHRKP